MTCISRNPKETASTICIGQVRCDGVSAPSTQYADAGVLVYKLLQW